MSDAKDIENKHRSPRMDTIMCGRPKPANPVRQWRHPYGREQDKGVIADGVG